ncbi:MAG: mandelate racemase/muconate lactonizing enzyme family protein [Gammaproteobacteria bacterium]
MSIIESVRSTLVDCPLPAAAVFSTRRVVSRQYLLVRVRCDDGVEGIGATYCGDRGGELCQQAVQGLLASVVLGRDPHATEALWHTMYQESLLQGRAGSVLRALGAIDIALWDHNARAAAVPLWKYLGAFHEGSVPAYVSGGYYYEENDEKHLAEEMARNCAAGFAAMKMKVGRMSHSIDTRRVAAAREAMGPDRHLMLDANNSWSDVPEAMRFLRRVADYEPYWIEEPFGPDDIDNHARLTRISPVPVATGEVEAGHWRFREIVRNEAANILQPDVFACGGITEWRRIANYAAACGLPVCTHAWQEFHAPLIAAAPNGLYVEYFADERIVNLQQMIDTPTLVRDGRIVLSDKPGLGFDFDAEAVDRLARIPWQEVRRENR